MYKQPKWIVKEPKTEEAPAQQRLQLLTIRRNQIKTQGVSKLAKKLAEHNKRERKKEEERKFKSTRTRTRTIIIILTHSYSFRSKCRSLTGYKRRVDGSC